MNHVWDLFFTESCRTGGGDDKTLKCLTFQGTLAGNWTTTWRSTLFMDCFTNTWKWVRICSCSNLQNTPLEKRWEERVQTLGAVIPGIVWCGQALLMIGRCYSRKHYPIIGNACPPKRCQESLIGSLSNNDGDGYENVTRRFKLYRAYSILFAYSIFLEFNP